MSLAHPSCRPGSGEATGCFQRGCECGLEMTGQHFWGESGAWKLIREAAKFFPSPLISVFTFLRDFFSPKILPGRVGLGPLQAPKESSAPVWKLCGFL